MVMMTMIQRVLLLLMMMTIQLVLLMVMMLMTMFQLVLLLLMMTMPIARRMMILMMMMMILTSMGNNNGQRRRAGARGHAFRQQETRRTNLHPLYTRQGAGPLEELNKIYVRASRLRSAAVHSSPALRAHVRSSAALGHGSLGMTSLSHGEARPGHSNSHGRHEPRSAHRLLSLSLCGQRALSSALYMHAGARMFVCL
ncbi:unnamed protein product [Lampetra planeri]